MLSTANTETAATTKTSAHLKDPPPPLSEDEDRTMKKVKIREEAIQTRANMIEEGISFRDKLLMLNGKQRDMNMEE